MVETSELSLALRAFLRTHLRRRIDPLPVAPTRMSTATCRVARASSAGFVIPGDELFSDLVRGGDPSFRVIPAHIDVQSLEEHHGTDSFPHAGVEADRKLGLPLDRLHELAANGEIG